MACLAVISNESVRLLDLYTQRHIHRDIQKGCPELVWQLALQEDVLRCLLRQDLPPLEERRHPPCRDLPLVPDRTEYLGVGASPARGAARDPQRRAGAPPVRGARV